MSQIQRGGSAATPESGREFKRKRRYSTAKCKGRQNLGDWLVQIGIASYIQADDKHAPSTCKRHSPVVLAARMCMCVCQLFLI